jgi:DNA-binding PadR family transcriptional regulator
VSLQHAILGFLNYKPFSGYDLKKTFDVSVNHFWPADQSQIYRTLAQLAEAGLVELEVIPQEDRPARKVYSITETGRNKLRRWLTTPLPHPPTRNAALIQVFFAGQLADEEILAMFEQEAAYWQALLGGYDQVAEVSQAYADLAGSAREYFFWMLTLESGIEIGRAHLAWLESVIRRLKDKEIPSE